MVHPNLQEVTCRERPFVILMICSAWKAGTSLTWSPGREVKPGFLLFLEFLVWLIILGKYMNSNDLVT